MVYDLQKADLWKRVSAGLFDLIFVVIVTVGLCWGISSILDYDQYQKGLEKCYDELAVKYDIDLKLYGTDEYDKLPQEIKDKYVEADKEFQKNPEAAYYFTMMNNLALVMVVVGVLLSNLVLEFVVPLILGNGQTLGKKIFNIGVMRYDGVKVSPLLMFVRTVLGKSTIEILIPVFLLYYLLIGSGGLFSIIGIAAIFIAQIVLTFVTLERTLIHDIMAQTCVIDMGSQLIFDTPEDLLEYKKKIQAENAAKASY